MSTESNTAKGAVAAIKKTASTSTGPRSSRGKAISKWNALKHGILAKAIVLSSEESGETQEEFDLLLASLRDNLLPVGALEEMFIEKIAICHWRQRRVLRSETGCVDESLGMLKIRTLQQQITEHNADYHLQVTNWCLRLREDSSLLPNSPLKHLIT